MLISIFNPMGAQTDRLRCEVCQNLFLSPINTGLLRYAVATALTVYGIETSLRKRGEKIMNTECCNSPYRLRYAPQGAREQRSKATMKSAYLKYLIEARIKRR